MSQSGLVFVDAVREGSKRVDMMKFSSILAFENLRRLNRGLFLLLHMLYRLTDSNTKRYCLRSSRYFNRHIRRAVNLYDMVYIDDKTCIEEVRMDRRTFTKLCSMLREFGKLKDTRHINVDEMVAMFLSVLGQNETMRRLKNKLKRSLETISRVVNLVLARVMILSDKLLKAPEAVSEASTDYRWKYFKVHTTPCS